MLPGRSGSTHGGGKCSASCPVRPSAYTSRGPHRPMRTTHWSRSGAGCAPTMRPFPTSSHRPTPSGGTPEPRRRAWSSGTTTPPPTTPPGFKADSSEPSTGTSPGPSHRRGPGVRDIRLGAAARPAGGRGRGVHRLRRPAASAAPVPRRLRLVRRRERFPRCGPGPHPGPRRRHPRPLGGRDPTFEKLIGQGVGEDLDRALDEPAAFPLSPCSARTVGCHDGCRRRPPPSASLSVGIVAVELVRTTAVMIFGVCVRHTYEGTCCGGRMT